MEIKTKVIIHILTIIEFYLLYKGFSYLYDGQNEIGIIVIIISVVLALLEYKKNNYTDCCVRTVKLYPMGYAKQQKRHKN